MIKLIINFIPELSQEAATTITPFIMGVFSVYEYIIQCMEPGRRALLKGFGREAENLLPACLHLLGISHRVQSDSFFLGYNLAWPCNGVFF